MTQDRFNGGISGRCEFKGQARRLQRCCCHPRKLLSGGQVQESRCRKDLRVLGKVDRTCSGAAARASLSSVWTFKWLFFQQHSRNIKKKWRGNEAFHSEVKGWTSLIFEGSTILIQRHMAPKKNQNTASFRIILASHSGLKLRSSLSE